MMDQHDKLVEELIARRDGLIAYMRLKLDAADWHGVADAAMDVRELVAQLELLSKL